VTTHAMLVFGRAKVNVVKITVDGQEQRLPYALAEKHFMSTIAEPAQRAHKQAMETWQAKRSDFLKSARVREEIEVKRNTGGRRKSRVFVDQVTIGTKTWEVDPGSAQSFILQEAERILPKPQQSVEEFDTWFRTRAVEHRTWKAEFITAEGPEPIELNDNLKWSWGFPIVEALSQLNRVQQQGWTIVHVSEDHGL